jgi:hypothetical protein
MPRQPMLTGSSCGTGSHSARWRALALRVQRLKVWFDVFTLTIGDSLRRSIDRGLAESKFGIVVLSEAFFRKQSIRQPPWHNDVTKERHVSRCWSFAESIPCIWTFR